MKIYLIRHGESLDNVERRVQGWSGSGLTDRGRAEAEAVGIYLASRGIKTLISSDLQRAVETAAIAGGRLGIVPRAREAFREMRLGPWEGRTMREEEDGTALWQWRYDGRRPPHRDVESIADFRDRLLGGLEALREEEGPGPVAVVTHGGSLSVILTHLVGLDLVRIWQMPTENGSISQILYERGRWQVVSYNETAHLPPRVDPGMNSLG